MGKLNQIFVKEEIRVKILPPSGEDIGVVIVFNHLDAETKARYDQIIQRGFGKKKGTYNEGDLYVFGKKFARVEGLESDDLGGIDPAGDRGAVVKWFLSDPQGKQLVQTALNGFGGYFSQVLPSADDDSKN